jgi:transposase
MAKYKQTDNSQGQFIVVNLNEQLLPGTFEWAVDYLINKADMSLFDLNYHNDEKGAAAYSPRVLLKAIFYCYSNGIMSSRRIEKACKNNITVKALAEDSEPDHDTIATFISGNGKAVKGLFTEVLLQCAQLDLITGEMFAEDGCKLPSNASKEWSGTIADLKKKRDKLEKYINGLLMRHQELDKDEGAKKVQAPYKKTMGDDRERRSRSIKRLENKLEKLNKFLEEAKPRMGVSGEEVQSNITDNESARIKGPHGYIQGYNGIAIADSGSQVIVSAQAIGSGPESGCFSQMLDSLQENMKTITGKKKPLKEALLEADTGYFSEENLQEAAKRKINVLIPDPQFRQRDPYFAEKKKEKAPKKRFVVEDFTYNEKTDTYKCPGGKELEYKCNVTLRNNSGKQYQAKRGTCVNCPLLEKCVNRRSGKNPVRTLYIIDKKYKDNLSEKMREKIDEPAYRELYSRRMQIIEPVYSDITYCKGMNRFTLRTQEKVNTQWLLFCIVHNIGKCVKALGKRYGA